MKVAAKSAEISSIIISCAYDQDLVCINLKRLGFLDRVDMSLTITCISSVGFQDLRFNSSCLPTRNSLHKRGKFTKEYVAQRCWGFYKIINSIN